MQEDTAFIAEVYEPGSRLSFTCLPPGCYQRNHYHKDFNMRSNQQDVNNSELVATAQASEFEQQFILLSSNSTTSSEQPVGGSNQLTNGVVAVAVIIAMTYFLKALAQLLQDLNKKNK
ncbi:hypothetical protein [Scytonema sp. PCC 10023]|uniref:hypothetical protein n=1 Tax=Scytonema sp. PCC 10023 TaxID=1680591 RepID=UPI0039C63EAA